MSVVKHAKIQILRGESVDTMPTLLEGELAVAFNEEFPELYIGTPYGNALLTDKSKITVVDTEADYNNLGALAEGTLVYVVETSSTYLGTDSGNVNTNKGLIRKVSFDTTTETLIIEEIN